MQSKVNKSLQIINSIKQFGVYRTILFFGLPVILILIGLAVILEDACPKEMSADDWPMWRYGAGRWANSPCELPATLHLQWVRKLPTPRPAWSREQYKLQFDKSYEPVVMGKTLFVPSMVSDSVTAYDTDTGRERWRFYSDGPVRFAPVAWNNKLYFVSDDGHLYCLNVRNGSLIWKFRGGPSERKILGNDRLISDLPARGAPVLYDDKIYFGASIWPFMGTFIHCLDAETGRPIWSNSGTGSLYIRQPHNRPAFSGVSPQGYFAATEEKLIVSNGRARPAGFDRKTGRFLFFRHNAGWYGKFRGGYDVAAWKDWFFNFGVMYAISDGSALATVSSPILTNEGIIGFHPDGDLMAYLPQLPNQPTAKGLWKQKLPIKLDKIHIKAGSRLYGSAEGGFIAAVDIPESNNHTELSWQAGENTITVKDIPDPNQPTQVSWQDKVSGEVWTMLAADGKLFVVTTEGSIYCFGDKETQPRTHKLTKELLRLASEESKNKVKQILQETTAGDGYCLLLGSGSGEILSELLRQSKLHIIVLEADSNKVDSLRRKLDNAGLYGSRAAVLTGDITSIQMPQYLAELIVVEDIGAAGFDNNNVFINRLFGSLRPYGGTACLQLRSQQQASLSRQFKELDLAGGKIESAGKLTLLRRLGPLPGSAPWTHQYGDIANTVCSKDQLVKVPLGLLWFGDRSDFTDVLPRHGHGPAEQVIGGRLFIEGLNCISARDVYTGRILWKKDFDNLHTFSIYYNESYKPDFWDTSYNQRHIAGANARGTNFVAAGDKVYVLAGTECVVLDSATGETVAKFSLPTRPDSNKPNWGYIGVYKDFLIGGASMQSGNTASKALVVMNRHTGQVIWQLDADHQFIHNAIAVGNAKIFCLDKFRLSYEDAKAGGNIRNTNPYRLLALEVSTGKILWQKKENIFGAWLGYSEKYDILLQGDWPCGDGMDSAGVIGRMITYKADNGTVVWDKPIKDRGPYILHDKAIITQRSSGQNIPAYDLLTGEQITRRHPLTGENVPWEYMRLQGCNTTIGAEHILTFRSSAAGYFDLENDGGTGNLGGFKSGCTSNLVVADGVLNSPDYTRTCTCSYQNQTSLALVHLPQAEIWTFNIMDKPNDCPIKRVGINFGAPGDRKADNGTLWLDYPSVGGRSPDITVQIVPEKPEWFCKHSSLIKNGKIRWVEASGAKGISRITIALGNEQPKPYNVALHFVEPDENKPGQRLFDVALQGKTVLRNFDIVKEAGAPRIGVIKEFGNIKAADKLTINLTPGATNNAGETVICGIELTAEEKSGKPYSRFSYNSN